MAGKPACKKLTPKQLELLKAAKRHRTPKKIGEALKISPKSVNRLLYSVFSKLYASDIDSAYKNAQDDGQL